MHFPTTTTALLSLLTTLTLADFVIYQGYSNDIDGLGGSWQTGSLTTFPYEPDCGMVGDAIPITSPDNNASEGGWACDGCNIGVASEEQDITRLEIYNGYDALGSDYSGNAQPYFNIETGSITLYKDQGYHIIGGDGVDYGYCDRTNSGPDDYNCPLGFTTPSAVMIFKCYSSLTVYGY